MNAPRTPLMAFLAGNGMSTSRLRAASAGEDRNRQVRTGQVGPECRANRRVWRVIDDAGAAVATPPAQPTPASTEEPAGGWATMQRLHCVALALLLASGASACASSTSSASSSPSPTQGLCDAGKVQWAIGKTGDQATMGRIWRESGAGLFRPLIQGQTPQRDHKPDRVNVHLDQDNRIVSIDCG